MRTIKYSVAPLSLGLVAVLAAPDAVRAGQVCSERQDFVEKLHKAYGERPASAGFESGGNMVEIFRSDGGSWTILATQPSGISCIVAVGEAWTEGDWEAGGAKDELAL